MPKNVELSVIIPTRNRVKLLKKTISSLLDQTMNKENYEILVIDNGSSDNTKNMVESFMDKINIKYFYDDNPGLHTGRHKGLEESKSDVLVYCDDDIEALPTWLEGIKESFEDKKVVLVGGKNLPEYEITPPEWITEMWNKNKKKNWYLSILDLGDEIKEIKPYHVWGCNFSIRKSVLLEAGGFHPDAMPQDMIKYRGDGESYVSEYILKKGYKVSYNPKASVYHFVSKERMTPEYFERRAFNQGISDSYTQIRNREKGNKNYQNINLVTILRNIKRIIYINYKKIVPEKKTSELNRIEKALSIKYNEGYNYHHNEVKNDPELFKWVLKDYYW